VCVCGSVCMRVYVFVCVWCACERERERERERGCLCMCVRVCVCVCACVCLSGLVSVYGYKYNFLNQFEAWGSESSNLLMAAQNCRYTDDTYLWINRLLDIPVDREVDG